MTARAAATVGQHDVLMGRDRVPHRHEGNRRFRDLIQEFREEYQQAQFRKDKKRIAETIISIITANGGRFLKHVNVEDGWCEVSEAERYEKVCHALRSAKRRSSRSSSFASMDASASRGSPTSLSTSEEQQQKEEEEESATIAASAATSCRSHHFLPEEQQSLQKVEGQEEQKVPTAVPSFQEERILQQSYAAIAASAVNSDRSYHFLSEEQQSLQNVEEEQKASAAVPTFQVERILQPSYAATAASTATSGRSYHLPPEEQQSPHNVEGQEEERAPAAVPSFRGERILQRSCAGQEEEEQRILQADFAATTTDRLHHLLPDEQCPLQNLDGVNAAGEGTSGEGIIGAPTDNGFDIQAAFGDGANSDRVGDETVLDDDDNEDLQSILGDLFLERST